MTQRFAFNRHVLWILDSHVPLHKVGCTSQVPGPVAGASVLGNGDDGQVSPEGSVALVRGLRH